MIKKIGETVKRPGALQASPELVEVQALMPMDPEDRKRLKADIKEHGIRDPLKVYQKGDQWFVLGGWNRLQIALELGISEIRADIYEGPAAERRDLVVQDNLNRRHLTATQRGALVDYLLELDPTQSNKSIARKAGTTKETVKDRRKKAEATGRISPPDLVKGRDGKEYRRAVVTLDKSRTKATAQDPALEEIKTKIRTFINRQSDRKKATAELIQFLKSL